VSAGGKKKGSENADQAGWFCSFVGCITPGAPGRRTGGLQSHGPSTPIWVTSDI
jgi:hypothetical protein